MFSYDEVGNRLWKVGQTTASVFDGANRLLEDAEFRYSYDNNGNLIRKTNKTTSEVTDYSYDAENRLIQVSKPGMTTTYRYDGLGRRIEKSVNGVITRYVYDGEDIVLEYNGGGAITARYTHGAGFIKPLMMLRSGTPTLYYHTDGLGSITELTGTTGAVSRSYVYDSFGQIASQTGSVVNPYTYTGREFDSESGLYYYRARYYDTRLGRFTQEDPIGFGGGDINLYAYVWNSPTNFVDPFGLWGFNWPDLIPPIGGLSCSTYFLVSNFYKLQGANKRGVDKYYHCIAFCQVGKHCGMTGLAFGIVAGSAKESFDCRFQPSSCEDKEDKDEEANFSGLGASESVICCEDSCNYLLP